MDRLCAEEAKERTKCGPLKELSAMEPGTDKLFSTWLSKNKYLGQSQFLFTVVEAGNHRCIRELQVMSDGLKGSLSF